VSEWLKGPNFSNSMHLSVRGVLIVAYTLQFFASEHSRSGNISIHAAILCVCAVEEW